MNWFAAPDIKKRVAKILEALDWPHIIASQLVIYRSKGSKSRAFARIWSLPRVWQQALKVSPHYVIEVVSERFDRLSLEDQDRTLVHELMHIPKTFSGALVPHRGRGRHINHQNVETLYQKLKQTT